MFELFKSDGSARARAWHSFGNVTPVRYVPDEISSVLTTKDWRHLSHLAKPCDAVQDLLSQWQQDGGAVLLRSGALHWKALSVAGQPQAGTNSSYRGIVTTSPSSTFLVLTNNTKTRRAREQNKTAPAYLDWMSYHEFTARCHHKASSLHYSQEYHYFQGIPHQELSLDEAFQTLPAQCWDSHHPLGPGSALHNYTVTNPTLRATSAGSVHALHYDKGVDTLLVMLQGRKAVTLVPTEQKDYLYPYPLGHEFARRAQVDLDHPDYIKFPLSKLVEPERFVMNPGDILFFSADTPHGTISETDVVSLTFRLTR
ncbi:TPA: hypothetical protein ACH3X1_009499 [Trebouxia sp. C0004]